jgi:transcriptional regulator with XRE-family HTH domain
MQFGCNVSLFYVIVTPVRQTKTKAGATMIGLKIRQLRKNKRMTQQELADKLEVTRSTISNYEIGRRTPHLKDLQRIAVMFGVSIDYFGVTTQNEAFELLTRAKEVFESDEIAGETKEEIYHELMKLYLNLKGANKNNDYN